MNKRQAIAALSLVGFFLASYLTLYKLGYIGTLACGTGGCETVQLSKWGDFLGMPVAAWGALFYLAMCAAAICAEFEWVATQRLLGVAMTLMSGWGVLFSGWLTWLEIARIHAICRYCVVSALLVVVLFVLSVREWRELRAQGELRAQREG
ncbi:MAG: vitamin K epoxide reductase family protein [Gemmatimonadetes bacterium]|nr:vitamin K epoxide reductase family protein [Gemmatimonadota bacterium]